jgi:hypothetical protein
MMLDGCVCGRESSAGLYASVQPSAEEPYYLLGLVYKTTIALRSVHVSYGRASYV